MANPSENSATKEGSKLTKILKTLVSPTHYQRFRRQEELLKETRAVMLVAVTLVAAVTFQAGVTPPGGVWQETVNCTICTNCASCPEGAEEHFAGQAIYSSQLVPFYFFLSCNTLAFSSSVYLLLSLTFGYPFFLEVLVATLSMSGTYIAAIFAVTPSEDKPYTLITLVAVLPFILRPAICLLSGMFRKEKTLPENETTIEF